MVLTALAFGGHTDAATVLIGTGAIVLWGAMATAVSPMMQSAAMRNGADDPDGASGLYVTAFQVGIMAGSLAGGLLYEHSVALMLAASAGLMGLALAGMAANRRIAGRCADKLTLIHNSAGQPGESRGQPVRRQLRIR